MMKRYSRILWLVLAICIFPNMLHAIDYTEHDQKVREEIWGWNLPRFKSYTVPEKYKNESAVIIARHKLVEVKRQKNFASIMQSGGFSPSLFYTDTERFMIKINDNAALKEFSEISFQKEASTRGYYSLNKFRTIIGAQVIKPDGTVQEVDVANESVSVTEGKNNKESYKKLAIPDLQVGDILDYFIHKEKDLESENVPPMLFAFYSQYPTLSYSAHCEFGKKLTVEYRSIKGAPEMKVTNTDENNTILDVEKDDLLKIDKIDETRWVSALRDLPMIRMQVLNNTSKLIYKPASARKSGIYNNIPSLYILNDAKCMLATQEFQMGGLKDINKKVAAALLNYKQKFPNATQEDLAVYCYNALRLYWPNNLNYFPPTIFMIQLEKLLKENMVECKIGFAASKYDARMDEITNPEDLYCIVTANKNKQFFSFTKGYRPAAEIPSSFQGEKASTIVVRDYKRNSPAGIEGDCDEYKIPETTAGQNKNSVKMQVNFSESNPLELVINRENRYTGDLKNDFQQLLILNEEHNNAMRSYLLIDKTHLQEMEEDKSARKYVEEWQAFYDKERKEQKDNIRQEVSIYHNFAPKEVLSYSVDSMGITPANPDLQYTVKYTVEGLVKKAGNNLLLDAGKLIGVQWAPTAEDRNRVINATLPTARLFVNEIQVEIPKEYEVQGIENLNYKMENEYGSFATTASIAGNTLKINTQKVYKKSFVPVSDWPELLKMADETNKCYSQSVILKKIQ